MVSRGRKEQRDADTQWKTALALQPMRYEWLHVRCMMPRDSVLGKGFVKQKVTVLPL